MMFLPILLAQQSFTIQNSRSVAMKLEGRLIFELEDISGMQTLKEQAQPLFLGYPHGPKTAEFVPSGRQKITVVYTLNHRLNTVVSAGPDSFACTDSPDTALGSTFGSADSNLCNSAYDRKNDWLFTVDSPATRVKSLGHGKYRFTAPGPCVVKFRDHYYRDHLGYFLWQPRPQQWKAPVAGWCSWMAYEQQINEQEVRQATDFFGKNLKDYGFKVIQIDDGYQRVLQHMDGGGPLPEPFAHYWSKPNEKFPSGLKNLARYIDKAGLTPGIWVGYYLPLGLKHKDGYTLDPNGKPHKGPWVGFAMNGLDPAAREEAYIETVKELHQIGWRYFKIDTLRHILYDNYRQVPAYWKERGESMEHAYRTILLETKKAAGGSYLLACWGTIPELAGIPDGCRIGEDVGPDFASMRRTAKYIAQFHYLNNVIWRNDPDYMCFRVPVEQAQAWATMNFMAGGHLMVSDPVSAYDPERVDILRKVGPPLFLHPMNVVSQKPDPEFLLLNCAKATEHWTVAARLAWSDKPAASVSLSSLGLDPIRKYLAFDFWHEKFLGVVSGSARFDLLKQGTCQVISFRPLMDRPQVLGTNRHLGQGAYELDGVRWRRNTLSGLFRGGLGRPWALYIHVPKCWKATSVGSHEVRNRVLALTFPPSTNPIRWRVSFARPTQSN